MNILGKTWYDQYTAGRGVDDQIFSSRPTAPIRFSATTGSTATSSIGSKSSRGRKRSVSPEQIKTLPFLHVAKPPNLTERALVFFPARGEFDATHAFQVKLLVTGATPTGRRGFASFGLPYRLPDVYVLQAADNAAGGRKLGETKESQDAGSPPQGMSVDWKQIWRGHPIKIAVLVAGLSTLTVILLLQNFVTRRPRLHRWIRIGFLSWTLGWLGW